VTQGASGVKSLTAGTNRSEMLPRSTPIRKTYLVDPGKQGQRFFVRPSEHSAEMVRDALESKKRPYNELVEVDNEGVQRAQQSYESVGLSFWLKLPKAINLRRTETTAV
jgi:hypothetical protein